MSDDIVTRIRNWHDQRDSWKTLTEAADEIERLRAAIRHLYFNEGVCYGDNCEQCKLVYWLCDDKAVRGQ